MSYVFPHQEAPAAAIISFEDWLRADVRIGTIVDAALFPEARNPSFKLVIDFGVVIGLRKSSAQITQRYDVGGLVGRQVIAVVNLPPRQIGKFMSEVLIIGVPDADDQVVLLGPDHELPNGGRLF